MNDLHQLRMIVFAPLPAALIAVSGRSIALLVW
jgi:hypothetical protein